MFVGSDIEDPPDFYLDLDNTAEALVGLEGLELDGSSNSDGSDAVAEPVGREDHGRLASLYSESSESSEANEDGEASEASEDTLAPEASLEA